VSRTLAIAVAAFVLAASAAICFAAEAAPPGGISISNEFVRIRVSPGPQEAGRFAVDTTGGDPSRSSDNDKVLIYGSREPWTSFTTVLVDDKPMIFGGPTSRRAGREVAVGVVKSAPHVSDQAVVCVVDLSDLEVTQELGFARSPTTRVRDAARIAYRITNRGQSPHTVGLRIVLDTMLGSNDGAPLRAGDQAIATATQLQGDHIPDYWQAFDSLSKPEVISQGTLRGSGVAPPDRLEMLDWGTLADNPWGFAFPQGADFTRRGEAEPDTAVALYWDPQPLQPGQTRSYATLYGVGGVSLSPAQLSLGLTAPAEVDYQIEDARPFTIIAYLENSGGFDSRGTACALELPMGFKLVEGAAAVQLGLLKPGETRQASWRAIATGEASGALKIAAGGTSDNLEPNRVEREITVNAAPQIALALTAPGKLTVTPSNRYSPNPFEIKCAATNAGGQVARNLVVTLSLPDGLKLGEGEAATQVKERLDPGKASEFTWRVTATGLPTGDLVAIAKATAAGAKPAEARRTVSVPWLTPEIRVYPASQSVPATTDGQPTLVPIAIKLAPAREFTGARVTVTYDANILAPLYVSRGEAFVDAGRLLSPWSAGVTQADRVTQIGGERSDAPALNLPEVTLFTIVFMVKSPGESDVSLEETSLSGIARRPITHRVVTGKVKAE
jgi:hypothetical protein